MNEQVILEVPRVQALPLKPILLLGVRSAVFGTLSPCIPQFASK
jgi:hypothetical protein